MKVVNPSRPTLFLSIGIGLLVLALSGFWFTYWKPLLAGESIPISFHVHAALWFGWLALLVIQAWLIRSGNTRLHRFVGAASIFYAALLIAVSFIIAVQAISRNAHLLDQTIDSVPTIIPLTQVLMFAVLFGLAIACRQQPDAHKRLMVLAALVAVTPAIARVSIGILGAPNIPLIFLVSNLLIVLVGYMDWRRTRRVHPIYLWGGLAILLVRLLRIPLAMSPAWSSVARKMSELLATG